MKPHDRSARLRVESLEGRSLLSTLATPPAHHPHILVAHPHAQVVQTVVITAKSEGVINQPSALPGQAVLANFAGNGNGHRYGVVDFVGQFIAQVEDQYSGAVTIPVGGGTLSSPNLGAIQTSFYGTEQIANLYTGSIKLKGEAAGASGQYTGWTGSFSANGVINTFNSQYFVTITIKLHPPKMTPVTM